MQALRQVLADDPRIAYALLFGSRALATAHESSDLDVAIACREGVTMGTRELGDLVSALERAADGRQVDLLLIDEAPPPVAYRAFRDGVVLVENDHRALASRKARAILEYLDFRPFEALVARGILTAAAHGR
jgi:predicted nucleotidyltransferase